MRQNINDKILASQSSKSSMTSCTKSGLKIKDSGNSYKQDPFAGVDPFKNRIAPVEKFDINYDQKSYEALDLNINNYSRNELYKLFGFKSSISLSEDDMKEAKKIVLKTHPDKSRLDNKYFVFFSSAYKKLLEIYEFQNKSEKNQNRATNGNSNEFYDETNSKVLDKMFDTNKNLKKGPDFNKWFNEQFEKHRLDEKSAETGYGDWLKSDEDIVFTTAKTKDAMNSEIEKRKRELQSLTQYSGYNSTTSNAFSGSSLMEYGSNFTSGSLFSNDGMGYTDLRQAYAESVIPVTEQDYEKMPKFKSIDEYKRHRETADIKPLDKESAMHQLYTQDKEKDQESAALAFYYAQQAEKNKKNQDDFWSGLKQLTNF